MDIALPALVAFILVLPGITFIWSFNDKRFKLKLKKKDFVVIVATALIPSLFVHLVGISIANLFSYTHIRPGIIGFLLTGTDDDATNRMIFETVFASKGRIFIYFLLSCSATYLLGMLLLRLVIRFRLDLSFRNLFEFDEWFYYLSGQVLSLQGGKEKIREVDAVIVDVLTNCGGKTTLYSGFVQRYTLNDNGIETLGLIHAGRWEKNNLIMLPGDYLVLQGKDICNLHFRYITVNEGNKTKKQEEPVQTKKTRRK